MTDGRATSRWHGLSRPREIVKKLKAADLHGLARITPKRRSVATRAGPRPEMVSSQLQMAVPIPRASRTPPRRLSAISGERMSQLANRENRHSQITDRQCLMTLAPFGTMKSGAVGGLPLLLIGGRAVHVFGIGRNFCGAVPLFAFYPAVPLGGL